MTLRLALAALAGALTTTLTATLAAAPAAPAATAAPRPADAVVTRVTGAPASAEPGAAFRLTVGLRNPRATASRATKLVVRLSRDARATTVDPVVGSVTAPRLRPRRTASTRIASRVPSRAVAASHTLFVCTPKACTKAGRTTVQPARTDVSGTLAGDLTFTDTGQESAGDRRTTWDDTSRLSVAMSFSGADVVSADFVSTGSEWSWSGTTEETDHDAWCSSTSDERRTGGGVVAWYGDPDRDDIWADVGRVDLGTMSLGVRMGYAWTRHDVSRGHESCAHDETTQGRGLDLADLDLTAVSRTASSVTYEVSEVKGEMGTTSDWDTVTGRLTLTLD